MEEQIKPIPQLAEDVSVIKDNLVNVKGFATGVAFAIFLLMGLLTLGFTLWKAGANGAPSRGFVLSSLGLQSNFLD